MKFCKDNLFYLNSYTKLIIDFPIISPSLAFPKLKYSIKDNGSFDLKNPNTNYIYLINPLKKIIEIKKRIQIRNSLS